MGFERFKDYKKVASQYKGKPLEMNELAIILKETCPKEWIRIRNNSTKEWPGEVYEDRIGPDGKKEKWAYRPNDHYDSVLFCKLFIQFEAKIRTEFDKVRRYQKADENDFLGECEDWICQTIRHYIPKGNNIKYTTKIKTESDKNKNKTEKKDASFKTLANMMLSNCTTNYMYKYLGLKCHDARDKDAERLNANTGHYFSSGKKYKHELDYSGMTVVSLDGLIAENKIKGYDLGTGDLNNEIEENRIEESIEKLRNKYLEEGDLISWMILDWQSDYSKLLQNQQLLKGMLAGEKNDNSLKYSKTNLKKAMIKILEDPNLCSNFGFSQEKLTNLFSLMEQTLDDEESSKAFDSKLNKLYKGSIKTLQKDVRDYGMCL